MGPSSLVCRRRIAIRNPTGAGGTAAPAAVASCAMTKDVSVIGLGRVGLPLALSFAGHDLDVIGVDRDPARLEAVRAGTMPFEEPGAQDALDGALAAGRLELSDRVADAA